VAQVADVFGGREGSDRTHPGGRDLLPEAFNRPNSDDFEPPRRGPSWRDKTIAAIARCLKDWVEQEAAFGHLFYWVPVCMAAGAILWFSAPTTPSIVEITVLLAIFSAGALVLRYRRPVVGAASGALALACLGAIFAAWETERAGTILLDGPVTTTVTGTITGREAVAGGRWRYDVDIVETQEPRLKRAPTRVTLTAPGRDRPIALGATVRGRARLMTPSGPALAGLNDFAFDAYFAGTGAIGYFYGRPEELTTDVGAGRPPYGAIRLFLEDLRGGISARIRQVLPGDAGAFAASMVTDDRRAISKETTEALRLAGLTHIVAISGLNMALAAGIFFVGFRGLFSLSQGLAHRYPIKKFAAFGALLTVTGYYMISGFSVSAERAYIMMAIILAAAIAGRPSISLRNVALSAIAILVLSPSAVLGPGFQMSYAATLALIAGYSFWQGRRTAGAPEKAPNWLKPFSAAWTFFAGVFMTSLIGGLSTALFSIEHFHRIAVWGLPANLLAMPIISLVVMPAGLAALVLMPIGLDWLPIKLMGIGLDMVIAIARWTASLDGEVVTGRLHGWFFAGLALCLLVLAILRSPLRFVAIPAGLGLFAANLVLPPVGRPDLVVHEDGRLAGLVREGRIATTEKRPGAFIFEQWQRALPAERHVAPIIEADVPQPQRRAKIDLRAEIALLDRDFENLPTSRFRCREGRWCTARAWNGSRLVVMELRELVGAACDRADIVITPSRVSWTKCYSGAKLLSQDQLRRNGTVEIFFDPENIRQFRLQSALGDGERPWYVHRIYDWRRGEYLPAGDNAGE
jgi:competence protein ComEC